jgi:hypothetical protein
LQFVRWTHLDSKGDAGDETALVFDDFRRFRLLIVPALFDEANRMRRFTVEVMRRLNNAGVDSFLPDLPGCNESLAPLEAQTPETWRAAVAAAANHFRASHVVGIRGGALLMPDGLPGWRYAPQNGANALRQMMRARIIVSREAGRDETQESLLAEGLASGLELTGHRLGAEFIRQFQSLTPTPSPAVSEIDQDMLSGGGLWLRAEPGEDRAQADALAAILAIGIKS